MGSDGGGPGEATELIGDKACSQAGSGSLLNVVLGADLVEMHRDWSRLILNPRWSSRGLLGWCGHVVRKALQEWMW